MIVSLLVLVIIVDLVLMYVIFSMYKKWKVHENTLSDITEERQLIAQLQQDFKDQFKQGETRATQLLEKVNKIAFDVEQELDKSTDRLTKNVNDLVGDLTLKLEDPIQKVVDRQVSLDKLLRKVEVERQLLSSFLRKSENIIKFFNDELSYQEIIHDIEQKKYHDARSLLTKGFSVEDIAQKLDISSSEVKVIKNIIHV